MFDRGLLLRGVFVTTVLAFAASGAEPRSPQEIINGLKEFQRSLGIPETGNFQGRSEAREAHFRCYYTGKLELPQSYNDLRFKDGTASGCALDEEKYDVFFYPVEAVADGAATVTAALAEAPEERQAVVVAHEDFHEMLHRLPEHLAEAAATLAGFVTAAEFARKTAGESSDLHRALAGEAELFLRKASVVNPFHQRLREVYERARRGELNANEALALKAEVFGELERECTAVAPEPRTFNRCPAALNNAGLAFDYTYTKHYPLFHELFDAVGRDVRRWVDAILTLASRRASEKEILHDLERMLRGARSDRALDSPSWYGDLYVESLAPVVPLQ